VFFFCDFFFRDLVGCKDEGEDAFRGYARPRRFGFTRPPAAESIGMCVVMSALPWSENDGEKPTPEYRLSMVLMQRGTLIHLQLLGDWSCGQAFSALGRPHLPYHYKHTHLATTGAYICFFCFVLPCLFCFANARPALWKTRIEVWDLVITGLASVSPNA